MKGTVEILVASVWVLGSACAGTFSLSPPLNSDLASGISVANTYTHAISGGSAATVNEVNFAALSPGVIPANFAWESTGGQNQVLSNNGDWAPATGGVTGAGLQSLLGSFTYAGVGAEPGQSQTFTLSGLTGGGVYDTRLYIRVWDTEGSGRPIDLTAMNGGEVDSFSIMEDRPGAMLSGGSDHQAYFINYRFTAQGTNLVINAAVPASAPANSGSFHMYALSNQVVPEPGAAIMVAMGFAVLGLVRRRR